MASTYRLGCQDFIDYETTLVSSLSDKKKTDIFAFMFDRKDIFDQTVKVMERFNKYGSFEIFPNNVLVFKKKKRYNFKRVCMFAMRLIAYSFGILPDNVVNQNDTVQIIYNTRMFGRLQIHILKNPPITDKELKTPPILNMRLDSLARLRFLRHFFMYDNAQCIEKCGDSWYTINMGPNMGSHLYGKRIFGAKFKDRARLILFDIDERSQGLEAAYEIAGRLRQIGLPENSMVMSVRYKTRVCSTCDTQNNETSSHLMILIKEAVKINHLLFTGRKLLQQIGIRVSGTKGYFEFQGKTVGIDIFPCGRGVRFPFGMNSFNFVPWHEDLELLSICEPISFKDLPKAALKKPTEKQLAIIKDMVSKKRLPDNDYSKLSPQEAYHVIQNAVPRPTDKQLTVICNLYSKLNKEFDKESFIGISGKNAYELIAQLQNDVLEKEKQEKIKLKLKEKGPLIRSIRLMEANGIPDYGMRHNLTRQYMLMLRKYLGNKCTEQILYEKALRHLLLNPNSRFQTKMEKAEKDTRELAKDVMSFTKELHPERNLKPRKDMIVLSPYGDNARLVVETIVQLADKYSLFNSVFSTSIRKIAEHASLSPTTVRNIIKNTKLKINGQVIPLIIGIRRDTFCYTFIFDINTKEIIQYYKKFSVSYNKGIEKIINPFSYNNTNNNRNNNYFDLFSSLNTQKPLGCNAEALERIFSPP